MLLLVVFTRRQSKMSRWNNKNCGFQKGHTTNKGKKLTKEHKEKVRQANLGKVLSQKTRKKVSSSLMGNKRGRGNKGRTGDRASNWKGGLTSLGVLVRNSSEYKRWRSDVFKRDYWTCQTCQRKGGGIRVQAHHKKPFAQIMGENHITAIWEVQKCQELWDVSNGVTLCEECHRLAHGKDL